MQTAQKARKTYIEREVATATPQKLQLMLIEAAIKNIHRVKIFWENSDVEGAFESLTRAQDIVMEILCSLDTEGSPEIAQSLASIYVFIFRKIVSTRGPEDVASLDEALRVLMTERESWKEICEKFGTNAEMTNRSATFDSKTKEQPKLKEIKPKAPHTPQHKSAESENVATGRSWDA
jgi:flagellar biosynthetic protein FliS